MTAQENFIGICNTSEFILTHFHSRLLAGIRGQDFLIPPMPLLSKPWFSVSISNAASTPEQKCRSVNFTQCVGKTFEATKVAIHI
jgi:hypothetical protein